MYTFLLFCIREYNKYVNFYRDKAIKMVDRIDVWNKKKMKYNKNSVKRLMGKITRLLLLD